MRTHELASFLRDMADALSSLPDTELTALPEAVTMLMNSQARTAPLPIPETTPLPEKHSSSIEEIHTILITLTKQEIVSVVAESGLDIPFRGKDSAKDVAGKIRRYIGQNPDTIKNIRLSLNKQQSNLPTTPLSKALGTLLGNRDELSITRR
ncbi:MAG: hypothetical protein F4Y49_03475 [Dehalococcoidia bacterium]|nr:hypothetical protein [Dehalococcoidia bacterium]